ncbi:sensor histidine kinase [Halobacteriovorax sp.]|uniref:sensor histidine kinase n=1 Tax=Halobacteriovorax sp. TaxID=2020862 RepID=UPI00356A6871
MKEKSSMVNIFEQLNDSTTCFEFLKSTSSKLPFKMIGFVEVPELLPAKVDAKFLFSKGVESKDLTLSLRYSLVDKMKSTILSPKNFLIDPADLDNKELIMEEDIKVISRIPVYLDCNTIIGILYFMHDEVIEENVDDLFVSLSAIGNVFSRIYFREFSCELPKGHSEVNLLKKMVDSNHHLISSVIHDLSNPLTIIYFETQKALSNLDKDNSKSLENIELSIDLIYKIIDSTKKFFSKNKEKEDLETIRVEEVIDFISLQYGSLLKEKDLKLESDGLNLEFTAFRTTFLNTVIGPLLSNSIRYSSKNAHIKLYGRKVDNKVEIVIEDQAGGFPLEVLENLESDFKSKPTPSTDGDVGSGMGLVLAKSYLQVMNGLLEIESLKQGSRIILKMSK